MRTVKESFKNMFTDGWYIEESENCERLSRKPVKLWEMVKKHKDGSKSSRYYFAYDVVQLLTKECGAKVVKKQKTVVWLNDNPNRYKPKKGHKIERIFK